MTITKLFTLDNNNKDCGSVRFRANGVCGGASLTWLEQAKKGNFGYNPHSVMSNRPGTPNNLQKTKDVMKVFCDTLGTYPNRFIAAAREAGLTRILTVHSNEISTVKAFKIMDSASFIGYYIVVCNGHIMAAVRQQGSGTWYLLDNMHGLFHSTSLREMLIKNHPTETANFREWSQKWAYNADTLWLIMQA